MSGFIDLDAYADREMDSAYKGEEWSVDRVLEFYFMFGDGLREDFNFKLNGRLHRFECKVTELSESVP